MSDPWTLYWQSDHLDSADALRSADDAAAIHAFWRGLAVATQAGGKVVDLATGNGTVPAALLNENPDLVVTGVDMADIDPLRFLSAPGTLASVDFRGSIDICSLPFDDDSFDAATSQFGIEYTPLQQTIPEAVRVIVNGGAVQFLMHHASSEILRPTAARRSEMDALLADDGVLQKLAVYVADDTPADDLEAAGAAYLASDITRTPSITGQIFEGINQAMICVVGSNRQGARELFETMRMRLTADRDRLRSLEACALDRAGFDEVINLLEANGVSSEAAGELRAGAGSKDDFVVGWQYCGRKNRG
jgi:ubiquinone/menaquinone biosynthesis C-methylase UbiE